MKSGGGIRIKVLEEGCFIDDSVQSENWTSKSTLYTTHPKPKFNI